MDEVRYLTLEWRIRLKFLRLYYQLVSQCPEKPSNDISALKRMLEDSQPLYSKEHTP